MGFIWTIIIGFLAGVIAKFLMPGKNEPSGFILTTLLGVVGAFVATYLGQALGWYRADEGAGLIGAVVGAIVVLQFGDLSLAAAAQSETFRPCATTLPAPMRETVFPWTRERGELPRDRPALEN
jgi:uncharacterized membrane protein YeaQ/YmgE (transglycosylase-associated protein family)